MYKKGIPIMESSDKVLTNIMKAMAERKITQKSLCEQLGIKQNAFTNWKAGNNTSYMKYLVRISEILNVPLDHLLGHTNTIQSVLNDSGYETFPAKQKPCRPIIGTASAGLGCIAEQEILGWESVDVQFDTEEYFYLKITGDSMAPRIEDGDLVLVHKQFEVEDGDIAVVIVNSGNGGVEGFAKKVEYGDNSITLTSFNPYYPPMIFFGQEMAKLTFVGRVVELKRKF